MRPKLLTKSQGSKACGSVSDGKEHIADRKRVLFMWQPKVVRGASRLRCRMPKVKRKIWLKGLPMSLLSQRATKWGTFQRRKQQLSQGKSTRDCYGTLRMVKRPIQTNLWKKLFIRRKDYEHYQHYRKTYSRP